jgi:hypothetical protein
MQSRYDFDHYHRDPSLRASDADRESTADRLRRHHADGRFDSDEFNERIDRCYASKTVGELGELVADLPGEHVGRGPGDGTPFRRMYVRGMIPLFPILIALIVVSAVTGWHGLWLVFPLFFLTRMMLGRRSRWGMRDCHHYSDQQPV